jgi:hypothetical protein
MHRFGLAVLVGVIAAMAFATTSSSAGLDRHFAVIAKGVSFEEIRDGFRVRFKLLDEFDRSDKVGTARARCREGRRKVRCHAPMHFNGEVGGRGDLIVEGNFGRGDQSFLVVNGSGDFDGVAGKMITHPLPGRNKEKWHFDLVR